MSRAGQVVRAALSHQALKAGSLLVLLASVTSASSAVGHPPATPRPAPHLTFGPPAVTPVAGADWHSADLRLFRLISHRPAATAPVHRLPKVRLARVTVTGIPPVVLRAYRLAALDVARSDPGCHLRWWLVAGIGLVESGHARSGGSLRAGWNGVARPPILGPVLDGSHGFKAIRDTDNGRYDGNKTWDRAVGPMQFLPSTWLRWAPVRDNGPADPQDIRAAADATARYLCAGGLDLATPHAMAVAVYSYNHSFDYVRLVLSVAARYAGMTPDQLGVNLLPTDRAVKHHRHRAKRHRKQRMTTSATPSPRASATTSTAAASPSPSPSGTPTSQPLSPSPTPLPLPTLSPLAPR